MTENVDHENGERYPYDEPLDLYVQKKFGPGPGHENIFHTWSTDLVDIRRNSVVPVKG